MSQVPGFSWTVAPRALVTLLALALLALPSVGLVQASAAPSDYPHVDPARHSGLSPDAAAASCWEIKELHPDAPSGAYWLLTPRMTAPAQFWCDQNTAGGGWVKIGHGRNTWETLAVGRAAAANLLTATPAANAITTQLSAAVVDALLNGGAVKDLSDGVRLRRARDTAGTTWQEVRLNLRNLTGWAWSMGAGHQVATWSFDGSTGTGGTSSSFGNDTQYRRVDTNISSAHRYTWSFSYGSSVTGTNDPASYLWTPTNGQGSARPFTEVFLRPQLMSPQLTFPPVPDSGTTAIEQPAVPDPLPLTNPWGVTGLAGAVSGEGDVEVQALLQSGGVMYVGGNFRWVQRDAAGLGRVEQSFLAAFDASTGEFIPTFAPRLNEAVRTLATLPDGRVLAGGVFTEANGMPVTSIVALDPVTGATSAGWSVELINGVSPGVVRIYTAEVSGPWVYIGGAFTHATGATGGQRYARNAARLDAVTGTPDGGWRPEFNGSVRASDISEDTSKAYLAGFFTAMAGSNALNAAALLTSSPAQLDPTPWNPVWSASKSYQQGIDQVGDRIFVGGSEHSMFGFSTTDYARSSTHITNPKGDFQALTAKNGFLYGGSHSNNYVYEGAVTWPNVGTSWTEADTVGWIGAWDTETAEYVPTFSPTLRSRLGSGIWAIEVASDGTVWAGGDIESGRVQGGGSAWLGAFVRFPMEDSTAPNRPSNLRVTAEDATTVRLAWDIPAGGVGPRGRYEIIRDDRAIGSTTSGALVVPKGGQNRFFVRAVDAAGNASASTTVLTVAGGNAPPTAHIAHEVNGLDGRFDGSGSTDDQEVVAYYWYVDSSLVSREPSFTYTFPGGGQYTVALVVVDGQGSTGRAAVEVDAVQPRPSDAYGAAVFDDAPSSYWRFDELTGTVAKDSASGLATGQYQSGVTLGAAGALEGTELYAAAFDGSDDQVVAVQSVSNPQTYSTEAWFRTTTTRGGKIMGFGNAPSGQSSSYDRHVFMLNDGRLAFGVWIGSEVRLTSPLPYNDGRWHHVVATQSPAGMALYVDGVLVGTNIQASAQNYTGYWRAGGDRTWSGATSGYLAGAIDEVAVYAKALTSQQVSAHFTARVAGVGG